MVPKAPLRAFLRPRRPRRTRPRLEGLAGLSSQAAYATASAAEATQQLLDAFRSTTIVRQQVLDANQLQKLALTLGQRQLSGVDVAEAPPPAGTPVPPGWHLVYFTPNGVESELGTDGTDRTFNSPAPFTRRMWAGGLMTWPTAGGAELRVGDEVTEHTRLVSAMAKRSRNGDEMVLVEVEKEFQGPRGLGLTDRRSWIFRPEIVPGTAPAPKPLQDVTYGHSIFEECTHERGFPSHRLRWSPAGLFRFSALTFNAHMIHYNEHWTKHVEGHPAEVVHGPLNLINILNYWRDVHGNAASPHTINYRALSPLYAGQTYEIKTAGVADAQGGKGWTVTAEKNGVVCMKAEIHK
ncbi:putative cytoplasmic protein [Thozetella sp. PMI_491]|nr:putative cytoplasmic protein [Thozetella sp. PMI_491]